MINGSSKNENIIFQSLNHVENNLKPWFLVKSGYYIVLSPSTALEHIKDVVLTIMIHTCFFIEPLCHVPN